MTQQSTIDAKIDGRLMKLTLTASVDAPKLTETQRLAMTVAGAAVRLAVIDRVGSDNVGLVLGPVEVRE